MGRLFQEYLEDERGPKYMCANCNCDVARYSSLIWEGFMGAQQPAFLFKSTVNIEACGGTRCERLSSGTYVLVDVRCRCCTRQLGWQYVHASSQDQRYKEGGVLLAQALLQRSPARSAAAAATAAGAVGRQGMLITSSRGNTDGSGGEDGDDGSGLLSPAAAASSAAFAAAMRAAVRIGVGAEQQQEAQQAQRGQRLEHAQQGQRGQQPSGAQAERNSQRRGGGDDGVVFADPRGMHC